ncbi:MAG: cytoplasmic filament protein CfpA, partial [Spirochaetota bacterium]|nr:cytoplasmic filament protein CfpA [Spirochaetota bacterium]
MEDHEKHHSDGESGQADENSGKVQSGNDYQDAKKLIDEEVEKILSSGLSKLPPEVLERLNIMGNIKEQLYDYVNISFVNIFNDYISNAEDEMAKKVSYFIEKEEERNKAKYSPKSLIELIEKLGDRDEFSTAEMEQSVSSMYSHLQKHIDQGISELELETRSTLEQNSYVGGSVSGENAYSIVKCLFKDDPARPETVYNVKLSINILESELINPIFHHQVSYDFIIKDIISHLVQDRIEAEILSLREELSDLGEEILTP